MSKREQFLYIVQTAVLANGINLSSSPERSERYRHEMSAPGVIGLMNDVIYASERIPEHLTAVEAATEFCAYMLSNLRESAEEAGAKMECPSWFARS